MFTIVMRCLIFIAWSALLGCESMETNTIEKNALSDELRSETTAAVTLPSGCPSLSLTLPADKSRITVSYQEPSRTSDGRPITDLAYTTIYVSEPTGPSRSIRVWTNDPHGGAQVHISEIPVSGQEVGLCVTATNWARKESPVATPPAAAKP